MNLTERKLNGENGLRGKHRTDLEPSGPLYLAELHGTWIKVVELRLRG